MEDDLDLCEQITVTFSHYRANIQGQRLDHAKKTTSRFSKATSYKDDQDIGNSAKIVGEKLSSKARLQADGAPPHPDARE